uniref:Multidrug and toxin extrusion protein n=3 Tax=Mesocestoides corti TaxID=53468 RepID=A0A5K3EUQ1_MESCO
MNGAGAEVTLSDVKMPELVDLYQPPRRCCISNRQPFVQELRKLCKFAIPITITGMLSTAMTLVSVIFTGRLGENELAAVGLALSIFNVTGFSIMHGLLSTSITIFSQTFGSGNKFQMGTELQKAFYIASICCLCCWGIFLSIEPLLLVIRINPLIAKMAAEYLVYMMPAMIFASIASVMEKYVQSQNKMMPPLVVGAITNVINAILHYLLLFQAKLGIKGSAISQSTSFLCAASLMMAYFYFSKLYKNTWNGFSHEMWYDWGNWLKLGIPGLAMIALKWWYFELGLILVGTVGVTELATQALLINLNQVIYQLLSVGLGVACSIIVGQSLGAGKASAPPSTIFAGLLLTTSGMVTVAILLVVLRWHVPKIFTSDPGVISRAAQCLPLLSVFLIFEGAVGVMGGAFRGAGLQPVGALIVFVCLYLFSGPLGFWLLLSTPLKLMGLWVGFVSGLFAMSSVYLIVLLRTNWQQQTVLAAERTSTRKNESHDDQTDIVQTISDDADISVDEKNELRENYSDPSVTEHAVENGHSRHLPFRILVSRGLLTFSMLLVFVCGLTLKLSLPLSDVFGSYCLHANGTFVSIPSNFTTDDIDIFARTKNCTIFTP